MMISSPSIAAVALCLAHVILGSVVYGQIDFQRQIQPILADNCFKCHGPDEKQREAGLRLDRRDDTLTASANGTIAIVPGDAAKSELYRRIISDDANQVMPPKDSGKSLNKAQKELLAAWINQGAEYRQHWAFSPPVRPAPPNTKFGSAIKNPIDAFVVARLEKEGLSLSKEADKRTLIRRACLDLIGLPPTPKEVDDFLNDHSENAYEKLLDRLLASPHYGERMALPWLDHARYADSNGYQSDTSREMWAWRDWVINAFNRNIPFDQFTVEQLAGDLLENPTTEQLIATGFNRNHRLNGEGGRIEAEWFVETVIDRVETVGLTWLGLTLNCCRCHDHKYDPISQREFYQLFAFFNSVDESGVLAPVGKKGENTPPLLTLSTPEQDVELKKLEAKVADVQSELDRHKTRLPDLIAEWERSDGVKNESTKSEWEQLSPTKYASEKGATLTRLDDQSLLASGANPSNDVYQLEFAVKTTKLTGLLLETMPDDALPNKSLGRGSNGNFVLTEVQATLESPKLANAKRVRVAKVQADYEQSGWPASSLLPGGGKKQKGNGWAIDGNDPQKRLARRVMFVLSEPMDVPEDAVLHVTMRHDSQFGDHNVGRFRWSVSQRSPDEIRLDSTSVNMAIRSILDTPANQRSSDQSLAVQKYYLENVSNPVRNAESELKAAQQKVKEFRDSLETTMIMKEGKTRDAFVLIRGQYDRPSEKVERKLPAILPAMPANEPVNRLGLSRWIASTSNPLTARVWVNRQWERLFGTGIVRTTENFGLQSEYPSHPELLDWLACEFMSPTSNVQIDGKPVTAWDMKGLLKLIMLSATYRQSSDVPAIALNRDPDNRLLARGPRFRLTGELLRDQVLAVSGLLVKQTGGPSARPYMPEGVWDETTKYGNLRNYKHEQGAGLYRRSMYTIWKRTAAPPSMLLFDAPNRETCTIKRSRTNTPLQALALLNEVTFVEGARKMAERMVAEGGTSPLEQINYGFRLALAREATDPEMKILSDGYFRDLERFEKDPASAKKLLEVGESKSPLDHAAHLAAMTMVANVVLNLDEFLTRE